MSEDEKRISISSDKELTIEGDVIGGHKLNINYISSTIGFLNNINLINEGFRKELEQGIEIELDLSRELDKKIDTIDISKVLFKVLDNAEKAEALLIISNWIGPIIHNFNKYEREYIHRKIYQEFAKGKFLKPTKKKFLKIIEDLIEKGAEGIILGCTELPLLIKTEDVPIPLFNTLKIHLTSAVDFAIS